MNNPKWSKILASTIVLSTIFSPLAVSAATDSKAAPDTISPAQSVQDVLEQARELGLMFDRPDGSFTEDLSRMELAKSLCTLLHLDVAAEGKPSFADVSTEDGNWKYIEAVRKAGFMVGDGEQFRPHDSMTNEEMAVVLVRALGLHADSEGASAEVPSSVSSWARDAVKIAWANGLLQADQRPFSPQQILNRQAVASVLVSVVDSPVGEMTIGDGVVAIGGIRYEVPEALRGLLNPGNQGALQQSKLYFDRDGFKLTKIRGIELQASDAAGAPAVLDGQGTALDGSVALHGSFTLKNMTVNGNVVIGDSAAGTATVVFEDAKVNAVNLTAKNAHVTARGKTLVSSLATKSGNATLAAEGGGAYQDVLMQEGAGELHLQATVKHVTVASNAKPQIVLADGGSIQDIVLPNGSSLREIVSGYDAFKSMIPLVNGLPNPDLYSPPTHSQQPTVNKTALANKIAEATVLKNASQVGSGAGMYPQAAMDAFVRAIADAQAVQNKTSATKQEVSQAVAALSSAIDAFKNSVNATVDISTLTAKIEEAQQLKAGAVVGHLTGQYKQADVDAFATAIEAAQQVADETDPSATEITAAYAALQTAMDAFEQAALAPLTISLEQNAKLYANSGMQGTADQVTLVATPPSSYLYHKQNIRDMIQVKRGAETEDVRYNSATHTYEVTGEDNLVLGTIALKSTDGTLVPVTPDPFGWGLTLDPADVLQEDSSVGVEFHLVQEGAPKSVVALPLTLDQTAPTVASVLYKPADSQFVTTISEAMPDLLGQLNGSTPGDVGGSIQVIAQQAGNQDAAQQVYLSNGADYAVTRTANQFVLTLTETGRANLDAIPDCEVQISVYNLYDFADNPVTYSSSWTAVRPS